ncbi:hypothetical protein YC2023_056386 [Brassica napus]
MLRQLWRRRENDEGKILKMVNLDGFREIRASAGEEIYRIAIKCKKEKRQ